MRALTDYLLRHRWQALILTFLITNIPVLGMASIVIAALFTLCVSVMEGALFTFVATLPYLLIFMSGAKQTGMVTLTVLAAAVLSVISNILTFVFAVLLRRHNSYSAIVQSAALLGVLVIAVIHLICPDVAGWWTDQLTLFYNQSVDTAGVSTTAEAMTEAQLDAIKTFSGFATGMVTAFILFTAMVQAILARWWQVAIVNRGRMGKELHYIRLSRLAGVLFLVSMVFSYLENRVVLDILPVICLLFGAAGLSLTHYLCGAMKQEKGRFWLAFLYLALIYSMLLPLFAVLNVILPAVLAVVILGTSIFTFMMLGLLDVFFDLRKRKQKV